MSIAPSKAADAPRYEDITETTDTPITREAASMLYSRYHFAATRSEGRRVLELGCAAGQGLGLISARAASVVGGDYSAALLDKARDHYGARVPFVQLSAEALPFRTDSFDVVLFFEATYYVPDMNRAFDEIARVLGREGRVLFVNANPERPDFIRSPHSHRYHSAREFREALQARGFRVTTEAAYPVALVNGGLGARVIGTTLSLARRVLEGLHLVPRTLRGRARLKRLIFGPLPVVPPELPADYAEVAPRVPVTGDTVPGFKVLYVEGLRGA